MINIETGDYEIGDDLVETSLRLRSKQTDAALAHAGKKPEDRAMQKIVKTALKFLKGALA